MLRAQAPRQVQRMSALQAYCYCMRAQPCCRAPGKRDSARVCCCLLGDVHIHSPLKLAGVVQPGVGNAIVLRIVQAVFSFFNLLVQKNSQ